MSDLMKEKTEMYGNFQVSHLDIPREDGMMFNEKTNSRRGRLGEGDSVKKWSHTLVVM